MNYIQLLQDKKNFQQSAGRLSKDINLLDLPGHQYFKIFFHFDNGDADYGTSHSGLLALPDSNIPLIDPTNGQWAYSDIYENGFFIKNGKREWKSSTNYDDYKTQLRSQSSAWSYLIENGEDERARLLLIFINLLLNITTNAPWYFQKISGLDLALERKATSEGIKIDELRLKITLTCLPDAIDHRIGTLLDLYRSIVFSWQLKKEIVPANLRKFDMSIYIFENPINFAEINVDNSDKNSDYPKKNRNYYTNLITLTFSNISYKYIELHNCEIDYGSTRNAYSELNNIEGMNPEYNIDIFFDDAYESRYNQWSMVSMGDMIKGDMIKDLYTPGDSESTQLNIQEVFNNQLLNSWPDTPQLKLINNLLGKKFSVNKFLRGAKDQLIGLGKNIVSDLIKRVYLGNLFTVSISNEKDKIESFASGNILNSARNVANVVRKFDNNASRTGVLGNLYNKNQDKENAKKNIELAKLLGSLFKAKSIKNNI